MMKPFSYIFSIYLLLLSSAQASMLDKVQLEEAIQRRIESNLISYDKNLRARVRFTYRAPVQLPGTALVGNEELSPTVVSESDIRGIEIEIHTKLIAINAEMQKDIYNLIPIRKSRIKLKHIQVAEKPVRPEPPRIVAKDFWDLSSSIKKDFSEFFLILVGASLFLLSTLFIIIHRSQIKNSKDNFGLIAKTLTESWGQSSAQAAPTIRNNDERQTAPSLSTKPSEDSQLELSTESLVELFADSYWCEEDAYAHWLWQKLSMTQKKQILAAWSPLKKYSLYFISLAPEPGGYHEHPYYLAPEALSAASQDVLQNELKNNPDLWLRLSPLRQMHFKIPIAEKLRIVKKGALPQMVPSFGVGFKERSFPIQAALGDLSFEDELAVLKKPEMIELGMRSQFKSLVWLSLQKPEYIESVLSRFDALSLATAWTASQDVLRILEKHLPEKKLKLLYSYKEKITPSKKSDIYLQLFRAGLNNEAA